MFLIKTKDLNREVIRGVDLPYKLTDGLEVIRPSETSVIVGADTQRNNISLIYDETESGLYRNNPRVPLLEFDNDNNLSLGSTLIIKGEDNAKLFINADINDLTGGLASLNITSDGGNRAHQIITDNGRMTFNTGIPSLVNNGFDFNIGSVITPTPIGTLPIFTGNTRKLRIDVALTTLSTQLSMSSNPISNISQLTINKGIGLQITSIITGLTVNASCGKIFTVNSTMGPLGVAIFTVQNGSVVSSNVVIANIISYTGTYGSDGIPTIHIANIANESFDVVVINISSTSALNGSIGIGFVVV